MFARRTRTFVFVCLLAASWLGAGNAAWGWQFNHTAVKDAAPGKDPKNVLHFSTDPCPDNITVDTWEQSSTLWRYTYEACKPEGAPAQHASTQEDLKHFVKNSGLLLNSKREYELVVQQWNSRDCLMDAIYPIHFIDVREAYFITGSIVEETVKYFKTNGRDPAGERMRILARVYNAGGVTENMYAMFDYSDPDGRIAFMKIENGKAIPVDVW